MTFSALTDWSPKLTKSCTPCTFFVGNKTISLIMSVRKVVFVLNAFQEVLGDLKQDAGF